MPETPAGRRVSRRTLPRPCAVGAVSSSPATRIVEAQRRPASAGTIIDRSLPGAADLERDAAPAEDLAGVRAGSGTHP